MTKKIAIVGSGISGLTCAYHLHDSCDITVFEAENYIGGHTHTVSIEHQGERADIDTGFIVFNDRTYPHFIALLDELGVHYQPTEMSFSVRNDSINLEYNGHTIATLFAQRSNMLKASFYSMLLEIIRFNKNVRKETDGDITIGQFLKENNYSTLFIDNYLLPMISAIWSMGLDSCKDFPLQFFIRFFKNHGLLDLSNRPQWYTIKGGSSRYIGPLTSKFSNKIHCNTSIKKIARTADSKIIVSTEKEDIHFDEIILACHGDQALRLLSNPSFDEQRILGSFQFTSNKVILHTDTSLLPKRKKSWASWNYRMVDSGKEHTSLTYNMNILQRLQMKNTYLVSLNQPIDDQYVLKRFSYSHPVYTLDSLASQNEWHMISGVENIHYCGAYWFNGFHEDGIKSGLRVVEKIREDQ